MKNRNLILCLILLFYSPILVGKINIKSMLDGMGTSFGAPPVGFIYNYEIWSDAIVPIYVEQQGIATFMGAFFPSAKGYFAQKTLPSIFDTAGNTSVAQYHQQPYYFDMFISENSPAHENPFYQQSFTQLPLAPGATQINYYHVFTQGGYSKGNSVHTSQIEQMGWYDPTQANNPDPTAQGSVKFSSQLSAIAFSNTSGTDVQVSLTYGTQPYTFTVEKYSYNSLGLPTAQPQAAAASTASSGSTASAPAQAGSSPSSAGVVPAVAAGSASSSSAAPAQVSIQAITPSAPPAITATASDAPTIPSTSKSGSSSSSSSDASAPPPLFSLRPNTITFSAYDPVGQKYQAPFRTLQLPANGFDGYTTTIEIFQDSGKPLEVSIQGLTPGNYDVGATPRNRDVTPCSCTFWYQSFVQGGSVDGFSDLPGQIWVVYTGADSPICSKVTPGQVVTWNLTRPLISQQDQFVYFIYVVTTDDTVAKNFVQKFAAQTIGQSAANQYIKAAQTPFVPLPVSTAGLDVTGSAAPATQTISPDQQVAALMGTLSVSSGVIQDTAQRVIGYIVGADIFTPKGLGFGWYYYTLGPSVMSAANIVSAVSGYLDSTKTTSLGGSSADVQTAITTMVNNWLTAYMKNPATVQTQVQKFLLQYGNSQLVDTTGKLTKFGKTCLQSIISGNVSLQYPSLKLSTVTNQYVYDFGASSPAGMPTQSTSLQQISTQAAPSSKAASQSTAVV